MPPKENEEKTCIRCGAPVVVGLYCDEHRAARVKKYAKKAAKKKAKKAAKRKR
jgi:hypothetical protein